MTARSSSFQQMMIMLCMSEIDSLLRLDLNQLVSLKTLLEYRSVTRAAKSIGMTQSAMSHRLDKLRDFFGDPLFVSTPHPPVGSRS